MNKFFYSFTVLMAELSKVQEEYINLKLAEEPTDFTPAFHQLDDAAKQNLFTLLRDWEKLYLAMAAVSHNPKKPPYGDWPANKPRHKWTYSVDAEWKRV